MTTVPDSSAFLQSLGSIVGPAHVLHDGDLSAWELDWRKRERGRALAVVQPASSAEVAAVVRACAAARVSWCRRGATPAWSAARYLTNLAGNWC